VVYEPIEAKAALISDPMFPGNAVIDILRETGIGIEFITDAEDIFFKLKQGNIGLILIDIVTINPFILDLIERLQSYVQEMPVIVMSAESTYRQLKPVLRFKDFYYLNKPYQNDEFLILVKRLLSAWAVKSTSARIQERFQARETELEIYAQCGRILAGELPIHEKLVSMFKKLWKIVPSECWNVAFVEPITNELIFKIVAGKVHDDPAPRFDPAQGVIGWVAMHKTPMVVENVRKNKRYDPAIEAIIEVNPRSMLCAPLVSAGRLVGVVQLINRSADTNYSDADLEAISPFVDWAALAVANAQLESQNKSLAIKDPLTGLYNTNHLDVIMDSEIERSSRYGTPVTFVMIDIDNYYGLCEQVGHDVGTRLVQDVARLLRGSIRSVDILARYTADRFGALLPNLSAKEGAAMADRLREEIEKHTFKCAGDLGKKITASMGVASYPQDAGSKNELMALTHKALQVAKRKGKNRVVTTEVVLGKAKLKARTLKTKE